MDQNTQTQLDPQAVMLAKAIRQSESGGKFDAQGKSGEYGAYQYTKPTWDKLKSKYGLQSEFGAMSPEDQNKAAYSQIKEWKDQGKNPGQIASMWNAGEGEPDAYTGKFSDGSPSVGKNKMGVDFNVPAYAESVAKAYHSLKGGKEVVADPSNPSSTAAVQQPTEKPEPDRRDWMARGADILTSIFGGNKIGEAIGTQIAKATASPEAKQYVAPGPSSKEVLGDVGQVGLTLASSAVGGEGLGVLGRLGLGSALGAGLGATHAIANKGEIGKEALTGGALGLGAGAVGEVAGKLLSFLPKSLVGSALRGADEETLQTALRKKFMTVSGGIESTQKEMAEAESVISKALKPHANLAADTEEIADKVINGYTDVNGHAVEGLGNSRYTIDDLINNAKKLNGKNALLWEKLSAGQANLQEVNTLRSALDREVQKVYKLGGAGPVAQRLELGAQLAGAMRDYVKTAEPSLVPVFQEYAKSVQLNKLLQKVAKRRGAGFRFGLYDITSFLAGHSLGGVPGGLANLALTKTLQNPSADIAISRGLQGAGLVGRAIGRGGRAPLINTVLGQLSK